MQKSYNIFVDSANWLCEINLLSFSMINRYLTENGHRIINDPLKADYIIIISCGFTKDSEDRTTSIYEKHQKRKKKNTTIIMFGCLIKINPELIKSLDLIPIDFKDGKKIDKILYNKIKFEDLKPYCDTEKLEDLFGDKINVQPSKNIPVLFTRFMLPFSKKLRRNYKKIIDDLVARNKILIEISKGCASNCKYCVIKKTRGKICSRKIDDIMKDVEKLYDPTKELFLVADDCSCYGMDIKKTLFDLLVEIKKKFPDLLINLDNINPYWLEKDPDMYIKLFSEFNISYATIPLQSGSNKIIDDMNRNYDIYKILDIVKKIKKVSPETIIYTHYIICYPNEKFIDFLKSIYSSLYFDLSILFVYSEPEESTSSSFLNYRSRFTREYRSFIFMLFHNFVTFYKLLTLQSQDKLKTSNQP